MELQFIKTRYRESW